MYFVRTYINYGPNYIDDETKRTSLYLEHYGKDFWKNLPVTLQSMFDEGKILFRARRETGNWAMSDTVFRDRAACDEYTTRINGAKIEEGLFEMGYTIIKEIKKIDSIDEVLNLPEKMYIQLGQGVSDRTL